MTVQALPNTPAQRADIIDLARMREVNSQALSLTRQKLAAGDEAHAAEIARLEAELARTQRLFDEQVSSLREEMARARAEHARVSVDRRRVIAGCEAALAVLLDQTAE